MTVKNVRGRETRSRILEAAAQEFASKGFREAKTADILAKLGMTQPAFYKHFPNKESIYNELVEEFQRGFRVMIQKARLAPAADVTNVRVQIVEAISDIFRFLNSNPYLTKLSLLQASNAVKLKDELATVITENIRFEQSLGYINTEVSAETVGECMVGMIERLTVRFLFSGEKTPSELAYEVVGLLGPALITV